MSNGEGAEKTAQNTRIIKPTDSEDQWSTRAISGSVDGEAEAVKQELIDGPRSSRVDLSQVPQGETQLDAWVKVPQRHERIAYLMASD